MKNITIIKSRFSIVSIVLALIGFSFLACVNDAIEIGAVDEDRYAVGDGSGTHAFVTDGDGRMFFHNIDFRNGSTMPFYLNVRNRQSTASSVTITYDLSALDTPNMRNSENHQVFPKHLVELTNGGVLSLAAGATQSPAMNMVLTSDGSLDPNTSYIIPLRIRVTSGGLQLTERDETKLIFVRDITALPDGSNNPFGITMMSCYEANDMNPLNHLSFTLRSTGELFFNTVIIFSANVNFDETTGRPFVFFNENIQPKLDRFDHYYRPLQERGVRIILSLLPNHDRAGLSNMTTEGARAFAQEVRAICDAFGLDGIMLDEEYMARNFINNPAPGFLRPSQYNLARMAFEIKQAQPHRSLMLYLFADISSSTDWAGGSSNFPLPDIDGIEPGEFIDFAIQDYNASVGFPSQIRGVPDARQAWRSQEWVLPRQAATTQTVENNLRAERDRGRLSHMIFGFDPSRGNWNTTQLPAMQRTANAYFEDEVKDSGVRYPIDWR